MYQLYIMVALPKILYGIDIWYTPPHQKPGKKCCSGSIGPLRKLESSQHIATLAITGALRTTPSDALNVHANILPMDLMLEKACHRAIVRMCMLPESNPVANIVKQYYEEIPLVKHPINLHNLLMLFKLDPNKIEKLAPVMTIPERTNLFETKIAETRIDSTINELTDDPDWVIYTDGSSFKNRVSASAVTYRRGQDTPVRKPLIYHLGAASQHSMYEAELVGLVLAAWSLYTEREPLHGNCIIYPDNQEMITAAKNPRSKSGQHLIAELLCLMEATRVRLTAESPNNQTRFSINWISAHSDIAGNERADGEAKRATLGRSSHQNDLPPIL